MWQVNQSKIEFFRATGTDLNRAVRLAIGYSTVRFAIVYPNKDLKNSNKLQKLE